MAAASYLATWLPRRNMYWFSEKPQGRRSHGEKSARRQYRHRGQGSGTTPLAPPDTSKGIRHLDRTRGPHRQAIHSLAGLRTVLYTLGGIRPRVERKSGGGGRGKSSATSRLHWCKATGGAKECPQVSGRHNTPRLPLPFVAIPSTAREEPCPLLCSRGRW